MWCDFKNLNVDNLDTIYDLNLSVRKLLQCTYSLLSILNLLIVSYLDCPVFEFLYLLQLTYPFNYFVLCTSLYLLVSTALLHFLKVFLTIFDFLYDRIEQILKFFIFFLLGLHVAVEEIERGPAILFFIVL